MRLHRNRGSVAVHGEDKNATSKGTTAAVKSRADPDTRSHTRTGSQLGSTTSGLRCAKCSWSSSSKSEGPPPISSSDASEGAFLAGNGLAEEPGM